MWGVLKDLRRLKFNFIEMEALVEKYEAFVGIKRLLKDIFREVEAFFKLI
jgi:hypothetical protein